MPKYDVLWSDGNGAASRGMSGDNYVKTHITAENESEMYKLAYLLRKAQLIKSASMKKIKSIKDYLIDDWGYEEDELKDEFEKNDYTESDLDGINLNGIDGGDPWIVNINLNGKKVYDCGMDMDYNEDDDEDW